MQTNYSLNSLVAFVLDLISNHGSYAEYCKAVISDYLEEEYGYDCEVAYHYATALYEVFK